MPRRYSKYMRYNSPLHSDDMVHTPDSKAGLSPESVSNCDMHPLNSYPATPPSSTDKQQVLDSEKGNFTEIRARRRAQNRLSQRAFRERRERHVKNLECQFQDLLVRHQMLLKGYWMQKNELTQLRQTVDNLAVEREILQQDSSSSNVLARDVADLHRRSRPVNVTSHHNIGRDMNMKATVSASSPATPSSQSSPSSSSSSTISSSLAFDEMNINPHLSNNTVDMCSFNIGYLPLDGPQSQQEQPFDTSESDINNIILAADGTYLNSLADWTRRLDGLDKMSGEEDPSNCGRYNDNDVYMEWNCLEL